MKIAKILLSCLLVGICQDVALARTIDGQIHGMVVKVVDGDTLTIRASGRHHKIRLADVDAPERDQPRGMQAWQMLDRLCRGRLATAYLSDLDRHGRLIARVECGVGIDAGSEMVRQGLAWVYVGFAAVSSPLYQLESGARQQRAGLWQDPTPIPPWSWRRGARR